MEIKVMALRLLVLHVLRDRQLQLLLLRLSLARHRHQYQIVDNNPEIDNSQRQERKQNSKKLIKFKSNFKSPCLSCTQLMLTLMLMAIIVYLYTVIAFNFFRKFYVVEEDEVEQNCHDLFTVINIHSKTYFLAFSDIHQLYPTNLF